jgi:hypothetical protein
VSTQVARFPRAAAFSRVERLTGVLPLLTIYIWLCLVYGWEAWGNATPWLFTDELEHAQLSRAISATGHAARRGVPHSADSLYSYLIAPAWWIHSTSSAYGAIKAINVVVMAAALFPTYGLARLLVSRPAALITAAIATAVPAYAYSSLILEEPLAYTWSILAIFLAVRALATPTRGWIAGAAVCALLAPAVRGELIVIPAALVLALALWWLTGERGRAWRSQWSRGDWLGFLLLVVGAVILFNGLAAQRSQEWLTATQHYKGRMLANGMWAVGAFVIGVGVLPLVAGIAGLIPGRRAVRSRAEWAFLCVGGAALLGYGWYTAVKAAYISTVFSTLVEERNMIYAAPILLVATALFFERRRAHPVAIALAGLFGIYLIVKTPLHMYEHFYADAPGLSILQSANRVLSMTPGVAQNLLLALLALSVVLVGVVALGRMPRAAVAGIAALGFLLAWNLTGEIAGARASHAFADQLLANFPRPLDWVDRATHRAKAPYYGQRVNVDPNGVWLLEFWNRSMEGLWTLDSSGVGPGPTGTPDILKPDGQLKVLHKYDYAITDQDVSVVGRVVATRPHFVGGRPLLWRVVKIEQPLRLEHNVDGIYPDGWAGERSGYSQFSTLGNARGFLRVTVSREGGGKTLPAHVLLRVGKLVLGKQKEAKMGEVIFGRRAFASHDLNTQFVVNAPPTPFRADVRVWPPFTPHELDPLNSDLRELGAQVNYDFVRARPLALPGKPPVTTGIYRDGWMGKKAAYTVWSLPSGQRRVTVTLSRPSGPLPAQAVIRVGEIAHRMVGNSLVLGLGPNAPRRVVALRGTARTYTFDAPAPPFRVSVRVGRTFVPGGSDTRTLGARVNFATS